MLLGDIQNRVLIPFTESEQVSAILFSILIFISASLSLFTAISLIRQSDIPLDTYFIISLSIADFCFGLDSFLIYVINGKLLDL